MFEDFFFRVLAAGVLAWVCQTGISAEFAPVLRFALMGWGLSERATLRLLTLLVDGPLTVASAVVYVLAYLYMLRPLGATDAVLLGTAFAYFTAFMASLLLASIRGIRKDGETEWGPQVGVLLLQLVIWPLTVVLFPLYWLLIFWNVVKRAWLSAFSPRRFEQALGPLVNQAKAFMEDFERNPRYVIAMQLVTGSVLVVALFVLYRQLGIDGVPMRTFLQFATYLFLACMLFQFVFFGMRKPEAAQLRWINPFAIAGSFVVTFTFYVAIYGSDVTRQTGAFLTTVSVLLILLWYASFLGRREVTIAEGRDALSTVDGDFQIDTAMMVVGCFYKFVVLLQPIFLAWHLRGAPVSAGNLAVTAMPASWQDALATSVGIVTILALTFLAVWARNIAKDVLLLDEHGTHKPIAGADGRDAYPVYRQQLAASALPYCVFVPALVFGALALLGGLPLRIAGYSGLWLDGVAFVLFVVILGAVFVQLPFRWGTLAWRRERTVEIETLRARITTDIASARATPPKARTVLDIIAGELTLQRLREEERELQAQQLFKVNVFGESISGTDAIAFVRGLVVTAATAGAGVLLNTLFQIPGS